MLGELLHYNILGLDAVHTGLELDAAWIAIPNNLRLYGMLSLANWQWKNDVVATVALR